MLVRPLPLARLSQSTAPWSDYVLLGCRILPLVFIGFALSPLWRTKDDLSDIPLTPKQRQLLGLAPSSRPATPGSTYVTPPRYSRSATPRSDASSRSGSPYSGSRGASPIGTTGYSPSPLFHKALNRDATRRNGSPGQALAGGRFTADSMRIASNTPSPKTGQANGIGLTSRWLYEKSRTSPMNRGSFS
jgi:nucleoporin POM34